MNQATLCLTVFTFHYITVVFSSDSGRCGHKRADVHPVRHHRHLRRSARLSLHHPQPEDPATAQENFVLHLQNLAGEADPSDRTRTCHGQWICAGIIYHEF